MSKYVRLPTPQQKYVIIPLDNIALINDIPDTNGESAITLRRPAGAVIRVDWTTEVLKQVLEDAHAED